MSVAPSPHEPKPPRERLAPSVLDPQDQLIRNDLELHTIRLWIKRRGYVDITASIVSGQVERTIDGASTVTMTINDPLGPNNKRKVFNSGYLGKEVDIELDGLWFRLVKVRKTGDDITLTFEDREIAILRTYKKFIKARRGKTTRAEFILRMIKEVKEFPIKYKINELHKTQPLGKKKENPSEEEIDWGRFPGLPGSPAQAGNLTVKGVRPRPDQLHNANTILNVGTFQKAPMVLMLASMMAATQEASMTNLRGGHLDSVGIFQQRPSWGTFEERHNVAKAAGKFFRAGFAQLRAAGGLASGIHPGDLAQLIQRSAFPKAYHQWYEEAQKWVRAYTGNEGIPDSLPGGGGAGEPVIYEFRRGEKKGKKEDSWTCIQRLADQVQWRAFFVSGVFYYISEEDLFKSRPKMVLSEQSTGVRWIDGDFDVGKTTSSLQIKCGNERWKAPPGTVVKLESMGPFDGRWLVTSISRGLFDKEATITIKKPLPELPEPNESNVESAPGNWNQFPGLPGAPPMGPGPCGKNIGMPGQGTHSNPPWESQNAIDLQAPRGTPIKAPFTGFIGLSFGPSLVGGNRIHIHGIRGSGDPSDSYYAHLDRIAFGIGPGKKVYKGQIVGYVGDTGSAKGTSPHLHFAVIPPFTPLAYQHMLLKCPIRPNLPER